MREGTLIYDRQSGRYDIRYRQGGYYGGLHCGTCLDVLVGDSWIPTSIEYSSCGAEGWYLTGLRQHTDDPRLDGLNIRI